MPLSNNIKKATSIIFDVALNSKYMLQLASVLLFYQLVCTVFLTEGWFFDLAGRVTRYFCEDDLLRTLVARQLFAVVLDFFFGAFHTVLDFDDGAGDLAQTLVRQADDCNVFHLVICAEEVFDLDRKSVV